MYGYIYLTTNRINGKQYVGQHTKSEFDTKYKGSGKALLKAFEKYGKDNFECHIIDTAATKDELNDKEYVYVELYQTMSPNGYNLMEGGGSKGKPSDETKRKQSEAMTGKYTGEKSHNYGKHHTEEHKRKQSEANTGKQHTEETKQKISEANTGKHRTEESKRKMSESHLGKQHTEDTKRKLSENSPFAKKCPYNGIEFGSKKDAYDYAVKNCGYDKSYPTFCKHF